MPRDVADLTLSRGLTAGKAAVAIVMACASDIDLGLTRLMQSDDPEGPHSSRVALRQLRTALEALEPMFRGKRLGRIAKRARTAFRILGHARDADVLVESIGGQLPPDERHGMLARAADIRSAVRLDIQLCHADQIGRDLRKLVATGAWKRRGKAARQARNGKVRSFARQALDITWTSVRDQGRGFARQDIAARHEFRKRIKKLRYLVDFFDDLWDYRQVHPFQEWLASIQTQLGRLNDLAHAEARHDLPQAVLDAQKVVMQDAAAKAKASWAALRKAGPFW